MDEDPGSNNTKVRINKTSKHDSGSLLSSLKLDWRMFWEGILGDDQDEATQEDPFITGKIQHLNVEQLKLLSKAMSGDRKKLNQRLESIQKEIELNATKLETLELVGGDPEPTRVRLGELGDMGSKVNDELQLLNDRLKALRDRERSLLREMK